MKSIYLDQNKWIDLAQAESGRTKGERFVAVLSVARKAVRAGKARFPISATHIKETAFAPRCDQREVLALLMTELSQGTVIRTPRPMVEYGIREALRRDFGGCPTNEILSAFGRGIEDAFNFSLGDLLPDRPPELVKVLRESLDSPAAWIDILKHSDEGSRKATVEHLKRISTKFSVGRQDDRRLLGDRSEVRRAFAARVTLDFLDVLQGSLAEIGKTTSDWGKLGPERLIEFWHSIPCVRVLLTLEECLHFETSREWHANDLPDLEFLAVAIPYCDVVVTERFWIHYSKTMKFDKKYETMLLSDLANLEETLTS